MQIESSSPNLNILRNKIDFTNVPFSDRGSRLLVFLDPEESQLSNRLAERMSNLDADIEAYLHKPPFVYDFYFTDEHGEVLEYEAITYPHVIYFRTEMGYFGLVFRDTLTLAIGLPPQVVTGVNFHVALQYWKENESGGEFKSVRDLAYATNAEILNNQINPDPGGYTVNSSVKSEEDSSILLRIGDSITSQRSIQKFTVLCDKAEKRWRGWFDNAPPVTDRYKRTYTYAWWVMANNLIRPKGSIGYEAMMPSKVNYVGLWLSKSAMHAFAFRHIDPELARNQIRAMLECQLPDDIRNRIIVHLTDANKFWGEIPIPSVARDDPHYDPNTMWRGPVWVNINNFFIEALRQVGEDGLADELTSKTLELIMQQSSIYEYYNNEIGNPPETAADVFGWSAAVFIDLAISESRHTGGGNDGLHGE